MEWRADSLIMESNGDTLAVPLDRVTELRVSRGRKPARSLGAGIGAVVGAVVGLVVGVATYQECEVCYFDVGVEGNALGGALFGGLVGTVAGFVVGNFVLIDRWVDVPLQRVRVSLGPRPHGRLGLGASVRF